MRFPAGLLKFLRAKSKSTRVNRKGCDIALGAMNASCGWPWLLISWGLHSQQPSWSCLPVVWLSVKARNPDCHPQRLPRARLMHGCAEDVILPWMRCMRHVYGPGYSYHEACTHSNHLGAVCLSSGPLSRHASLTATLSACQGPGWCLGVLRM